jgi:hypothetical protein
MQGDDAKRYCAQCDRHVHNVSAMSERKRRAFIARAGRRICIAYLRRPDGSVVTPSCWSSFGRLLQPVRVSVVSALAALLPFAFTSCATDRSMASTSTRCGTDQHRSAQSDDEAEMIPGEGPAVPERAVPTRPVPVR